MPVTVTVTPVGPLAGEWIIDGTVTVKIAEAESAGTEPTSAPYRTTRWPPADALGTVKVHVKAPLEEVVCEVQVSVVMVPSAKVIEPICVFGEKPAPEAVTVMPTGP